MHKQMWLEFVLYLQKALHPCNPGSSSGRVLEALWAGFPEQARSEVTELYARLMAQMLAERVSSAKEVCDESKPR